MNYFSSKVALYLPFLALPLLTQCGGENSADTFYNDNKPNDSVTITEADLQTLQSGDGFIVEEGNQVLVITMTGDDQAKLKFSKGNQSVEGASSSLTWQAKGTFVYTLTINSSIQDFSEFSTTVTVDPTTAKKETNGKIFIKSKIMTITQSTPPFNGAWVNPTLLLSQKP